MNPESLFDREDDAMGFRSTFLNEEDMLEGPKFGVGEDIRIWDVFVFLIDGR